MQYKTHRWLCNLCFCVRVQKYFRNLLMHCWAFGGTGGYSVQPRKSHIQEQNSKYYDNLCFLPYVLGANSVCVVAVCIRCGGCLCELHWRTCLLAFNSSVSAALAKNKDYKETYKRPTETIKVAFEDILGPVHLLFSCYTQETRNHICES